MQSVAYAQTGPTLLWQSPSGGTAEDNIARSWLCSDGSFIMCGQPTSNNEDITGNHGYNDDWVIKLEASENMPWQRSYE